MDITTRIEDNIAILSCGPLRAASCEGKTKIAFEELAKSYGNKIDYALVCDELQYDRLAIFHFDCPARIEFSRRLIDDNTQIYFFSMTGEQSLYLARDIAKKSKIKLVNPSAERIESLRQDLIREFIFYKDISRGHIHLNQVNSYKIFFSLDYFSMLVTLKEFSEEEAAKIVYEKLGIKL